MGDDKPKIPVEEETAPELLTFDALGAEPEKEESEDVADDEPKKEPSQEPEEKVEEETTEEVAEEEKSPVEEKKEESEVPEEKTQAVAAKTHAKNRKSKTPKLQAVKTQKVWQRNLGFAAGLLTITALILSGVLSQYYKNKTLPNVYVSGISSSGKTAAQLKSQLQDQQKGLKFTIQTADKKLEPKLEEIGFKVDVDATVKNSLDAKRRSGIFNKLAFWKKQMVPAVVTVNDTLLNQYIETHLPEMTKPAQDSQLQFDAESGSFNISGQADGQGPDVNKLKDEFIDVGNNVHSQILKVNTATKKPIITEAKLKPLLEPANELVKRRIVLSGLGFTFQASPSEIAGWITPTPQKDGAVKLVIDTAKIQSYVDGLGKRISSAPVDQKVVKDETTGAEVVLQYGRNGTELADRQVLANAIAESLKNQQDTTQTMNIQTAAFKTVNMNAYDKWIEVDLSEQRTTAYERATPIKNFLIASGMRGYETVTGEFAIWLKVRSQTMKGGSKADGSYYNLPNVEWVSYFYQDYALHGAYWRKVFGYPASHGCVNMTNEDAHWVYDWAPVGTKVIVHQ
jgi:lipoprotein-anchoring transpeptidase ErfK/SrfK